MIQNTTKYAATRRFCRRLHVKNSCRKKIPRAIHTMHSGEKLWHAKLVIGPSAVISQCRTNLICGLGQDHCVFRRAEDLGFDDAGDKKWG